MPTAESVAGDFRVLASPACNAGRQLTLPSARGFTNNQISPALLSPVGVKIAGLLPKSADPCGKVTFGLNGNSDQKDLVVRTDYQLTNTQSLFGRVTTNILGQPSTFNGSNPLT